MTAKPFSSGSRSGTPQASFWSNALLRIHTRGPGDMENAMRRIEIRHGIPWRSLWTLRYRPPADVAYGLWEGLRQAYEAECEKQCRLLKHEEEITRALSSRAASVRKARALLDKMES